MFRPVGVDLKDYHRALSDNHRTETTVSLLSLEHEPVSRVTANISGQVNWLGSGGEVSRTASLEILDPGFDLPFDSENPADGVIYANRLVRIEQTVFSPLLPEPATVPVFTGPAVRYGRQGDTVTIEAQGMEQRLRTDHAPVRCGKHMRVVDAIERILRAYGIRRMSLPSGVREKLPKDIVVGRQEKMWGWPVLQRLARSIGMQLYFDARGVAVLRDVPNRVLFRFNHPVSLETRAHDWTEVYNRVQVDGKKKVRAAVAARAKHPFSPVKMGAYDEPWQRTFFYSDDKIGNKKQATKVARSELQRVLEQRVSLSFTHMPVWHLDPRDRCAVGNHVFALSEASVPLAGGDMTVGYTRKIARPRR